MKYPKDNISLNMKVCKTVGKSSTKYALYRAANVHSKFKTTKPNNSLSPLLITNPLQCIPIVLS